MKPPNVFSINQITRSRLPKLFAQKLIGLMPRRIAFSLNELAVKTIYGGASTRINTLDRSNKFLNNLQLMKKHSDLTISGKTVLEIGTGWHGIDLIWFHILGATNIITVDHWSHIHYRTVAQQIIEIQNVFNLTKIHSLVGEKESATVSERLDTLANMATEVRNIHDIWNIMHVTYYVRRSCDLENLPITKKSIDLFYSESVLQRIPEKTLSHILKTVGFKLLKNEGVIFARTDQKDINTQDHMNSKSWGLTFLKYDDFTWNLITSEKLNYQNRLRESDFVMLFSSSNIHLLKIVSSVNDKDVKKMNTFKPAKRFSNYAIRDLATTASIFIGKKNVIPNRK